MQFTFEDIQLTSPKAACSHIAAQVPSQAHQWESALGKRCPEEQLRADGLDVAEPNMSGVSAADPWALPGGVPLVEVRLEERDERSDLASLRL